MLARHPPPFALDLLQRRRRVPEIDPGQRGHEAGAMRVRGAGRRRGRLEQLLRSGEEVGTEPQMPLRCDAL